MSVAWRFSISPDQLEMPLARECGWVCCHYASPLDWHRNDGFELTFALKGSVVWQVHDGPDLRVSGGELSITKPRILHRGQYSVVAPVDLFYVVINPSVARAQENTVFSISDLKELARRFHRHGNRVVRASVELLKRLNTLRATFVQLSRHVTANLKADARAQICQVLLYSAESLESVTTPPAGAAIANALTRLQKDPAGLVSMDDIAADVGLGRSSFYEQFRTVTGMTPADYLQRLRCMRAAESLACSPDEITHIAFDHGFSSSQYFSKCFRKYLGTTPSNYRKMFRNSNGTPKPA
jgi:AraC-like DNA-binding protein